MRFFCINILQVSSKKSIWLALLNHIKRAVLYQHQQNDALKQMKRALYATQNKNNNFTNSYTMIKTPIIKFHNRHFLNEKTKRLHRDKSEKNKRTSIIPHIIKLKQSTTHKEQS